MTFRCVGISKTLETGAFLDYRDDEVVLAAQTLPRIAFDEGHKS